MRGQSVNCVSSDGLSWEVLERGVDVPEFTTHAWRQIGLRG